jgi:Na+-driven multidrug efflux pump
VGARAGKDGSLQDTGRQRGLGTARRVGEQGLDGARVAAGQAVWLGPAIAVPIDACGLLYAADIPRLMAAAPDVAAIGVLALRIIACGFGFWALGLIVVQAFNGSGDTRTPTLVNLVCFWLLQIPLAWWLTGPAGLGPTGVFVAVASAESVIAVVAVVLFRRGRWRHQQV